MSDVDLSVVIGHDGAFPALRPVRVSYFDPATGEPCDHQVGAQVSRPVRPKKAPNGGRAPFNGYPADAGARTRTKRVCAGCGKAFMVPREARNPPRRCPECRKAARLEADLRARDRKERARRPRVRTGARNPGRAGVEVWGFDRLTGRRAATWPTIKAAADAHGLSAVTLRNHLATGPVMRGWTALVRSDDPRVTWPRPVVADDGRVRVAFADREAVRDAFGLSVVELSGAVDHGRPVGFHGREVSFEEVAPSAGLADMRRWRP